MVLITYGRRFLAFIYGFLVGDAWELFVGPVAALLFAWVLLQLGVAAGLVGAGLFCMVVAVGAASVAVALRHAA